jgi:tetratricopeptide (TPR) repeat protein
LTAQERVELLSREALLLLGQGQPEGAIASCDQALELQPDAVEAHHYRGIALEHLGQFAAAVAAYDRAIACTPSPSAQIWSDRGNALRSAGNYPKALESYDRALGVQPEFYPALSSKGSLLALLGKPREALAVCDRAIALQPDAADAWNSRGVALLRLNQAQAALGCFEQALERQPDFDRALCNRGVALLRLEQPEGAIASLEEALNIAQQPQAWHVNAWISCAFAHLKLGQYEATVASCDRALAMSPNSYPAALYRLVAVLMAGQVLAQLKQLEGRRALLKNLTVVVQYLKFRLLVLVGAIALLAFGQGTWLAGARTILPLLISFGVILLVLVDLWKHRSRLNFVWTTYFRNHPLTYLRSLAIVLTTLTIYGVADSIAPPFLRWGWASWVFGNPGNIIFQPFNLFRSNTPVPLLDGQNLPSLPSPPLTLLSSLPHPSTYPLIHSVLEPVERSTHLFSSLSTHPPIHPSTLPSLLFALTFWLLLLFGIPFWARLEERIFRRGANSWRQIAVRSTQFGLAHLFAGIPLLGGFVLIVPGFLFACRYKYIFEKHLKQTGDLQKAQEAGFVASTADHAIYNAILITLAVAILLFAP